MPKFYQTDDFKKLNDKWKKKLEKEGFKDIEQDDDHLKTWASSLFTSKKNGAYFQEKEVFYQSREEYYRLAGQFLHEYEFASKREKVTWEMHAQGTSIRDIVKALKRKGYKTPHRDGVHKTLQRLSEIMVSTCQKKET